MFFFKKNQRTRIYLSGQIYLFPLTIDRIGFQVHRRLQNSNIGKKTFTFFCLLKIYFMCTFLEFMVSISYVCYHVRLPPIGHSFQSIPSAIREHMCNYLLRLLKFQLHIPGATLHIESMLTSAHGFAGTFAFPCKISSTV